MSRREAAVLIPLRMVEGTLEVYLAQRSPELSFLGGFHSFPGGTLDEADHALSSQSLADSPHHSAALREAFEELGVLPRGLEPAGLREAVLSDSAAWQRWVEQRGALPELALIPMGRWITPPFASQQYDALYFACWFEGDEPIRLDRRENCAGLWIEPDKAIEWHNDGRLFISFPVLETLRVIKNCDNDIPRASEALKEWSGNYAHGGGEMIAGVRVVPLKTPTLPPATHTNAYLLARTRLRRVNQDRSGRVLCDRED
ncbi:MAG: NUDIX domain-containing protein, partial [Myxococcota bacterium]